MARIRTIKPEFWTDPDIVGMPMDARLFFIGCWNHADDYGVLKDDPGRLRLQIMPADDIDAKGIVDELVARRHLLRMVAPDGTPVLVIRTFSVHQKIDKRAAGRYGKPEEFTPSHTDSDQSPPIPTDSTPGREGKGREVTPVDDGGGLRLLEADSSSQATTGDVEVVFDAWVESTGKRKGATKLTPDRRRLIRKQLALYDVTDLVDAVRGWRKVPHNRGDNDRRTVYNDLELLLRDAKHIEQFRDAERSGHGDDGDAWMRRELVES